MSRSIMLTIQAIPHHQLASKTPQACVATMHRELQRALELSRLLLPHLEPPEHLWLPQTLLLSPWNPSRAPLLLPKPPLLMS